MSLPQSAMAVKREEVSSILAELRSFLKTPDSSNSTTLAARLEKLKIHGREPLGAEEITTSEGINTLARAALTAGINDISREALKCLANALLLNETARQVFVDGGWALPAVQCYKLGDTEEEFLCARLLFLLTYGTDADFASLVEHHGLATAVTTKLAFHASLTTSPSAPSDPHRPITPRLALTETLKLLFNITHHHPSITTHFASAAQSIRTLILAESLTPPINPTSPLPHLIAALLPLPPDAALLFPPADPALLPIKLITILRLSLPSPFSPSSINLLPPLLTLLETLHSHAPPTIATLLQTSLLPTAAERKYPLGHNPDTSSLPTKLLRLLSSTTPYDSPTRAPAAALLLELSQNDPDTLVRNVGFGIACGILASAGLSLPGAPAGPSTHAENVEVDGRAVDFVTGQFVEERERVSAQSGGVGSEGGRNGEEMSEEEELREAERLYVLFERMRATGVIKVENPVHVAAREGGFVEDDDNHDGDEAD